MSGKMKNGKTVNDKTIKMFFKGLFSRYKEMHFIAKVVNRHNILKKKSLYNS